MIAVIIVILVLLPLFNSGNNTSSTNSNKNGYDYLLPMWALQASGSGTSQAFMNYVF